MGAVAESLELDSFSLLWVGLNLAVISSVRHFQGHRNPRQKLLLCEARREPKMRTEKAEMM